MDHLKAEYVDMKSGPGLIWRRSTFVLPLGWIGKTRKGREPTLGDVLGSKCTGRCGSRALSGFRGHLDCWRHLSLSIVRRSSCTTFACCTIAMNLGLLDLRVPIHTPKALCIRFYYCASATPVHLRCYPLLYRTASRYFMIDTSFTMFVYDHHTFSSSSLLYYV